MSRRPSISGVVIPLVLVACACWHQSNGDSQGFYACLIMSWLASIHERMR